MKSLRIAFFILIVLTGCSREDGFAPPAATDSVQRINRWIYDSMNRYYYWEQGMPRVQSLEGDPEAFFSSLVSASDTFSYMSTGVVGVPVSRFDLYGVHFATGNYTVGSGTQYVGVITFVHKNSGAWAAGLRRGMLFQSFNGTVLSSATLPALETLFSRREQVRFGIVQLVDGALQPYKELAVWSGYYNNGPVFNASVFSFSGKNTGYICISHLNEQYDQDLLNAFAKLKQQQVSELVLDLRFNPGGSVASAAKVCMLIAMVKPTDIFGIYKGNKHQAERYQSFSNAVGLSANNAGRKADELRNKSLGLNRVFVLMGAHTASAAELIINNLSAYIEVVRIGETSFGKDLASASISDQRSPKQVVYTLHPIVYRMYNAKNEGGYHKGLPPAVPLNDLGELPVKELGDPAELLLANALHTIYGKDEPELQVLMRVAGNKMKLSGGLSRSEKHLPKAMLEVW